MRIIPTLILLMLFVSTLSPVHADERADNGKFKETESTPGYWPKNGLVPDAKTAIKIAVAIWEPIYGIKHVAQEAPFHAVLKTDVWTVTGSVPRGKLGGQLLAVVAKKDGRIIKVYHSK
jgi:hypothetical protein